jgi:NAD(P)-dependent dehydrogenase (short-subunit alcohol dehydrogenase family)
MSESTNGKNIVITGASTGNGAVCALRLDSLGFRVFAGVRKESDGEALKARASERLRPIRIDVTQPDQIAAAAAEVSAAVGAEGLAGLVNNAGIAVAGPLEFLPIGELRQQLEINVIGLVAVTQAFLPLLRKARGRIVNIGSISGKRTRPFVAPYAASKHAIEAISDGLRMELKAWGIEVSLLEPGTIATPIWEKSRAKTDALEKNMPEECRRLYGPAMEKLKIAIERIVKKATPPEVIADIVVHALTAPKPKTRYLVGRNARLEAFLVGFLTDRAYDRLLLRILGIPSQNP